MCEEEVLLSYRNVYRLRRPTTSRLLNSPATARHAGKITRVGKCYKLAGVASLSCRKLLCVNANSCTIDPARPMWNFGLLQSAI